MNLITNSLISVLPDPPVSFTVETSLSKELLKLSFKDRLAIEEEIHGVRCGATVETPELLDRSLSEFDLAINERKENDAYSELLRNVIPTSSHDDEPVKSKCYLNDPNVRLRFLRCDCFGVQRAVQRLINFLEFTSEVFGDFVAERPISVFDFNSKEEESALQNSRNQYLPFRDRSGRRVFTGVGHCDFQLSHILRFKIMIYLHWVVSEDVETQRKGAVILAWIFDETDDETKNWNFFRKKAIRKSARKYQQRIYDAIPVRVTSIQHFYPETMFFRALSALYVFSMSPAFRPYYKVHFGTSNYSWSSSRFRFSSRLLGRMHIRCGRLSEYNQTKRYTWFYSLAFSPSCF